MEKQILNIFLKWQLIFIKKQRNSKNVNEFGTQQTTLHILHLSSAKLTLGLYFHNNIYILFTFSFAFINEFYFFIICYSLPGLKFQQRLQRYP